jgi:NSS family neurotransmitter:Na+ symporter
LAFVPGLEQANAYEALDHITSNVMLPLGGLCLALFVGWIVPEHALETNLKLAGHPLRLLRLILRYVVPGLILVLTLTPFMKP